MKHRPYRRDSMDHMTLISGLLLLLILLSLGFSRRAFSATPDVPGKPLVKSVTPYQYFCNIGLAYSNQRTPVTVTMGEPSASVELGADVRVALGITKSHALLIRVYRDGVKKSESTMKSVTSMIAWATPEIEMTCFRHTIQ